MALTGLHVACGFAGEARGGASTIPLLARVAWSETIATDGTTTMVAPQGTSTRPIFSVTSSVDAWIATGPNPNAATGPRRLLRANVDLDFFVDPGDKLAWVTA